MTTLISKYKIYGRTKGRKKKRYNLDQTFVNNIITKDITEGVHFISCLTQKKVN